MKALILIAISLIVLAVNQASACSYYIDEAGVKAELQNVTTAYMGEVNLESAAVSNFTYFESKAGQMCPEEITYNATVTLTYNTPSPLPQQKSLRCTFELSIEKIQAWDEEGKAFYTLTGKNNKTCDK